MTLMKFAFIVLIAVTMALTLSCGQRDNPADPEQIEHGSILDYARKFGESDPATTWLNHTGRLIRIYLPPQYADGPEGKKFPTLYLLHDFTGNQSYYLLSRIQDVADRLIASGEIEPMVIVMPNASAGGLGTFYTDGWSIWNPDEAARKMPGDFESMIWDELMYFMEVQADPSDQPFNIIPRRASRAIGGIGMGGYGALRIALKHPEIFSSVSTVNGFLSFEDMMPIMIDQVFAENGVTKGSEDGFFNSIDTSYSKPYTNLLYSMAAAYSQHDLLDADSATLITRYQVDLPFDADGEIVESIFDKWLENDFTSDLSEFLMNGWFGHLDSTALYIDYSNSDRYDADEQALQFMDRLDDLEISYQSSSYSGYPGYPASHDAFRIERIEEMLKFHSKHLSDDPGTD